MSRWACCSVPRRWPTRATGTWQPGPSRGSSAARTRRSTRRRSWAWPSVATASMRSRPPCRPGSRPRRPRRTRSPGAPGRHSRRHACAPATWPAPRAPTGRPRRRAPASEQPELQSRIGWLSKELGDDRTAQRAFGRSRTSSASQPVVTYGLLAVTSVISLLILLGGQSELESWLLLDKFAVHFQAEYWRLLTVALVHGSLIHLMFNMYALWIIGPIVEALYGPWRYLGIYALCAVAGSVASYATSPNPGCRRQRRGLRALRGAARGGPRAQARPDPQRAQPDGADRRPHRRQPDHRLQRQQHRQCRAHRRAAGGRVAWLRARAAGSQPGIVLVPSPVCGRDP